MTVLTPEECVLLLELLDKELSKDAPRAHELCRIEKKLIEGMANKEEKPSPNNTMENTHAMH